MLTELIIVLLLLQIKHLFCDWVFQPEWMWSNKHIYGHPGGIAHALFNAVGTAAIIGLFYGHFWLVLLLDFMAHYHIDWVKMNVNNKLGLTPQNPKFWALLGLDQYLHQITYLLIIGNFYS